MRARDRSAGRDGAGAGASLGIHLSRLFSEFHASERPCLKQSWIALDLLQPRLTFGRYSYMYKCSLHMNDMCMYTHTHTEGGETILFYNCGFLQTF